MFSLLKEEMLHVIYEGLLFAMFFLPYYSFNLVYVSREAQIWLRAGRLGYRETSF